MTPQRKVKPQLSFLEKPKRKPPRVMAKLLDAGSSPTIGCKTIARFGCKKCGWETGWIDDDRPDSEIRKGRSCEICNKEDVK